jgi:hypothetical protein
MRLDGQIEPYSTYAAVNRGSGGASPPHPIVPLSS